MGFVEAPPSRALRDGEGSFNFELSYSWNGENSRFD